MKLNEYFKTNSDTNINDNSRRAIIERVIKFNGTLLHWT
jgi:hypothetical protein